MESLGISIIDVSLKYWQWLAFALILGIVEVLTMTTYFLWAAIAALIVGVLLWFAPEMTLVWQLILFGVLTVVNIILGHNFLNRGKTHKKEIVNQRMSEMVGQKVKLTEAIVGGRGKIYLSGAYWVAEGPDLPKDEWVLITATNGLNVVVEKYNTEL